jgi:hypothetical protein
VDVGKMKEVALEPSTPAEILELFLMELILLLTNAVWNTARLKV